MEKKLRSVNAMSVAWPGLEAGIGKGKGKRKHGSSYFGFVLRNGPRTDLRLQHTKRAMSVFATIYNFRFLLGKTYGAINCA
jgi:hypothetical protein